MQHLSTKYARNQTDLMEMQQDKNTMKDELIKNHALSEVGWYVSEPGVEEKSYRKMEKEELEQAIRCLFQSRPTAHVIDIKPTLGEVKEHSVMQRNSAGFTMTMASKAEAITSYFLRDHNVQGFKYELHDVGNETTMPSMSLTVYTVDETDELEFVPVSVFFRWRKNF